MSCLQTQQSAFRSDLSEGAWMDALVRLHPNAAIIEGLERNDQIQGSLLVTRIFVGPSPEIPEKPHAREKKILVQASDKVAKEPGHRREAFCIPPDSSKSASDGIRANHE